MPLRRKIGIGLGLTLCGLVPHRAQAQDSCAALRGLKLPNVEILIATRVSGDFTEDFVTDRDVRTYRGLRPFCRVRGISRPVPGSEIGFELWLPQTRWNGRLHMVGNGAYISNIQYRQMIARLEDGDVAVATDTGHQGSSLKFGWRAPEKIKDFGHRAVHESVVAAKAVTRAFYGKPARFSYFSGCSTGGYQGLSEAQRYPQDFDGIIAGAPGNNRTNLTLAFLWNYLANHRPGDDSRQILHTAQLKLINRAVTRQCDKLDKVADGVISDPLKCRFQLKTLACKPGMAADSCLTAEQITAAQKIYDGPRDARTGARLYPGYPFGTEGVATGPGDKVIGWEGYWAQTERQNEPSRADMFRYWVFDDTNWNWWKFNWGSDVDTMQARLAGDFNAVDPDLSAFHRAGGRMLMFMGWQDPVGSPIEAINYYDSVAALSPGRTPAQRHAATQRFLRLYMVPGMDHCAGGPGASAFNTATRDSAPPVDDARHDMLRALEAWVEQDRAPTTLIATRYARQDEKLPPAKWPIEYQRPICVWPAKPEYVGGPVKAASSFRCVTQR
jgi:feruloyl esterase